MEIDGPDFRRRREALGLSRRKLAEAAQCSPTFIQLVEFGLTPEHSTKVPRVVRALGEFEGQPRATRGAEVLADAVDGAFGSAEHMRALFPD